MRAFTLRVRSPRRGSCAIRVGEGVLDALVESLAGDPPGSPLVLIADDRVGPLHAASLARRLRARGLDAALVVFPRGERRKTRATKAAIEDRLLALGAGRDAAIVAVGGGVTADVAGFVAATWHRGIPVVQVPTTLLAMADAAVGGKTAVNLPGGKNLVGAFHAPVGVWADVATLETLPDREFRSGLAEVVKAAVVGDARLFGRLEREAGAVLERSTATLERVLAEALAVKARIVAVDPEERGRRAALNFGHTVGHAIEAVSAWRIPHGRAVAAGLVVEARLAVDRTGFPRAGVERIVALLSRLGLPAGPPRGLAAGALARAARRDKKTRRGRIRCALPLAIGRMPAGDAVTVEIPERELAAAIRSAARDLD